MSIETIIAAASADFLTVVSMTDAYVPACSTWVGDYPYLKKQRFKMASLQLVKNSSVADYVEDIKFPSIDRNKIYKREPASRREK